MKQLENLIIMSLLVVQAAWGRWLGEEGVGGWSPIGDVKDRHVVEIAEYAVSEYDRRSRSSLRLERVVSEETQVVSGMNYRLVVAAMDADATKTYQAVVWEKPWLKSFNLTSFTPLP